MSADAGAGGPAPGAPIQPESEDLYVDESAKLSTDLSTSSHTDRSAEEGPGIDPSAGLVHESVGAQSSVPAGDSVDDSAGERAAAATIEDGDRDRAGELDHSAPAADGVEVTDESGTDLDRGSSGDGSPASEVQLDLSEPDRLTAAIEAVLFVVESPVSVSALAAVVQQPITDVEAALDRIAAGYHERGRGVELRRVAGGIRIYTRPELSDVVEAFLMDGQRTKLSQAALETLAVIAYRQPVTRSRISAIRGVNVDGVVRTLTARGLIVEEGTDADTGAGLYRTTVQFLEKMGMQSLDELPSLAPLLPEIDTLETDEL